MVKAIAEHTATRLAANPNTAPVSSMVVRQAWVFGFTVVMVTLLPPTLHRSPSQQEIEQAVARPESFT